MTWVEAGDFAEDPIGAMLRAAAEMEVERAEHPERFETITDEANDTIQVWRRADAPPMNGG